MGKPKPNFTIEELTLEALNQVPEGQEGIFTNYDLRLLWGCTKQTVLSRLDKLISLGWQAIPAKKSFVDRLGRPTHTMGYRLIPPNKEAPD